MRSPLVPHSSTASNVLILELKSPLAFSPCFSLEQSKNQFILQIKLCLVQAIMLMSVGELRKAFHISMEKSWSSLTPFQMISFPCLTDEQMLGLIEPNQVLCLLPSVGRHDKKKKKKKLRTPGMRLFPYLPPGSKMALPRRPTEIHVKSKLNEPLPPTTKTPLGLSFTIRHELHHQGWVGDVGAANFGATMFLTF